MGWMGWQRRQQGGKVSPQPALTATGPRLLHAITVLPSHVEVSARGRHASSTADYLDITFR
jgi:hypothetical protein